MALAIKELIPALRRQAERAEDLKSAQGRFKNPEFDSWHAQTKALIADATEGRLEFLQAFEALPFWTRVGNTIPSVQREIDIEDHQQYVSDLTSTHRILDSLIEYLEDKYPEARVKPAELRLRILQALYHVREEKGAFEHKDLHELSAESETPVSTMQNELRFLEQEGLIEAQWTLSGGLMRINSQGISEIESLANDPPVIEPSQIRKDYAFILMAMSREYPDLEDVYQGIRRACQLSNSGFLKRP